MAKILYAERFGVEPHTVNPPVRWWFRVSEWDAIRRARHAREYVDAHTAAKSDESTRKSYAWLVEQHVKLSKPDV